MNNNLDKFTKKKVIGIILAGGRSRRFGGGHKFLKKLSNKLLIEHVIDRLRPQTDKLIINSNSDPTLFSAQDLTVVPDSIGGYQGPLAGILTGMEWVVKNQPTCEWIVTCPSDAPFIPLDFVGEMQLCAQNEKSEIVCVSSGERAHPVCGLWHVSLATDLRKALINEGVRKIDSWTANYRLSIIEFSNLPYDPFFNINRLSDMETAEKIIKFNELRL